MNYVPFYLMESYETQRITSNLLDRGPIWFYFTDFRSLFRLLCLELERKGIVSFVLFV